MPRQGKIRKKGENRLNIAELGRRSVVLINGLKANSRLEIGHWEMDTVKGVKNGSTECLLTIT
ncbi:MAG: hypothetical protein LBB22_02900, partial [Treponema sp.]|nr:hypothetical protein [Treponema sp.]